MQRSAPAVTGQIWRFIHVASAIGPNRDFSESTQGADRLSAYQAAPAVTGLSEPTLDRVGSLATRLCDMFALRRGIRVGGGR